MRRWLHGRHFSLKRLLVAILFFSAFVGLNSREIGPMLIAGGTNGVPNCFWGWPLPVYAKRPGTLGPFEGRPAYHLSHCTGCLDLHEDYEFPLTHQTYRLVLGMGLDRLCDSETWLTLFLLIDALLALTVLALILFLHPRRKPPAEAPT